MPAPPIPRVCSEVQPALVACESAKTIAPRLPVARTAPRSVESSPLGPGGVGRDDLDCRDGEGEADRDVDQEDRLPADERGERTAEEHADCGAGATDRAPGTQCASALMAFGERGHDDRQGGGREHRRAEPLAGAGGEQRGRAGGQG